MPESESQTVLILLYSTVGLLVMLSGMVFVMLRRLARIQRRMMGSPERSDGADSAPAKVETSAGGAFEMFLSEDPSRRNLPKGEQFAEYRKWRQEKGLNWSNS